MNLIEHIPPSLLDNGNVRGIAEVLNGMQGTRTEQLLTFENILNPLTSKDAHSIKNYLFDAGQLPRLTDVPMFLIERLIMNARTCFGMKGTPAGLDKMAWATIDGTIDNLSVKLRANEFFVFNDIGGFGYFPDGNDLGVAVATPDRYPFLFSGSFSLYYGIVTFDVYSDYISNHQTRVEWIRLLVEFLPMSSPGSTAITVSFYTLTGSTFLETLNI